MICRLLPKTIAAVAVNGSLMILALVPALAQTQTVGAAEGFAALTEQAAMLYSSGRYMEAERRQLDAVRLLEQLPGKGEQSSLAVSYAALAQILLVQGKLTASERYATAAQNLQKESGPGPLDRLFVDTVVSRIRFTQGRHSEALETQLSIVRAVTEPTFTNAHEVATALNDLGMIQAALGDLKAARESVEPAVAACRKSIPDPGFPCGLILRNLALISFRQGDLAGAEPLYRESIQRVEADEGVDSTNLGILLKEQSELMQRLGRKSEARRIRRRAETILRSSSQALSLHTIDVRALRRER